MGWIYKQFLLSMLKPDKQASVKAYKAFMAETDDEVENVLEGKKWPSFLGSAGFAEWIKAQFYPSKTDDEVPRATGSRNAERGVGSEFRKQTFIYPDGVILMNREMWRFIWRENCAVIH